jgi:SAM-dependent methyltransferase
MRAALPSRSPTTTFNWAAATRKRGIVPGYEGLLECATLGFVTQWEGDEYQRRFDELASSGVDVHGEASFVMLGSPGSVLDAGCGTGRVAIELARRGVDVVGVDVDASMLATARANAPGIEWHEHDLATVNLDRVFDVVLLAGNVPLFTAPGTHRALVAGCARHVAADGVLITGFQLGRGYELDSYDADCRTAGLVLTERFSTWAADPYRPADDYAVSVHRLRDSIGPDYRAEFEAVDPSGGCRG